MSDYSEMNFKAWFEDNIQSLVSLHGRVRGFGAQFVLFYSKDLQKAAGGNLYTPFQRKVFFSVFPILRSVSTVQLWFRCKHAKCTPSQQSPLFTSNALLMEDRLCVCVCAWCLFTAFFLCVSDTYSGNDIIRPTEGDSEPTCLVFPHPGQSFYIECVA